MQQVFDPAALGVTIPEWPAPQNVIAFQSNRKGGCSGAPFATMNVGDHVGDVPEHVAENRDRLFPLEGPVKPVWLQQVHGTEVLEIDRWLIGSGNTATLGLLPKADAAVSRTPRNACLIMTADCLPVFFCNRQGTVVAAAHAGWRGLCDGILENTVKVMKCDPSDLLVWLGPAIGPLAFEVGAEVRAAFVRRDQCSELAFEPTQTVGKWLGNLQLIARKRLTALGVDAVYGGVDCTFSQPDRYFSYRRDGQTGRMVSAIWLNV
jgi:polyphenol oxidase